MFSLHRAPLSTYLAVPLAFVLSITLIQLLAMRTSRRWFLDHPNERSLHASPVPRVGGLGLVPAALLSMAWVSGSSIAAALSLVLMLVSVVDDWKGLSPALRFPIHLLAAGAFVWLLVPELRLTALIALGLLGTWMINLYNFMDGSDGLAGGMAVIGFGTYAAAAMVGGDAQLAVVSLSVSAAAAGFLLFNFPPARVFMGDAGSIPLGFLAWAIGLQGWNSGLWPLWFPVVVFGPFVVDATVTLIRRMVRGERVWMAHRSHYYQRLILLGWSHRRTAAAEAGLMLVSALVALWGAGAPRIMRFSVLTALALTYLAVGVVVDRRWGANRRQETEGQRPE